MVIKDPPLKNVVSREVQCDAPVADLNVAPRANNQDRPIRRALSEDMDFNDS